MDIIYENGKYYRIVKEEMPEGWVLDMENIKVEITKLEKVKDYGKEKEDSPIIKK